MSSDSAGVSRSAVTEDGRSKMPRMAPAHRRPRVLSRSRASRRNVCSLSQTVMDSSSAGGLVNTRTTSGIVGSIVWSAATARSRATSSRRRSVTVTSARRTMTTRASSSERRRARTVSRSRVRSSPEVCATACLSGPASSGFSECSPRPMRQTRPPRFSMSAEYSPFTSPGTIPVKPKATSPVISRLTIVDLPMPGCPWIHMPVFDTSPSRSHSEGSRPIGSAVCMWRPTGTPGVAAPELTANGNRPHTC